MLIISDKKIDDDQDDLSFNNTVQKQITGIREFQPPESWALRS